MKKVLATLLLVCATVPAFAQHYHGHGHWQYRSGPNPWVWVAPTVIGGVIGYEIARNQPPVVVQQPVIVQPQPTPYYGQSQNCSPWTEVQNPDGTITRTRTCAQ
jgi:hypothetical protein